MAYLPRLIKMVWVVDPLICSNCGGEMHIISFIGEARGIRRALEYLGLWSDTPCGEPPPNAPTKVSLSTSPSMTAGAGTTSRTSR